MMPEGAQRPYTGFTMPRPTSLRAGLLLAVVAVLALGAWQMARRAERAAPGPPRVLVLGETPGSGLTAQEARAIHTLVIDALEAQADVAVTRLADLPAPQAFAARPGLDGLVVRLQAVRVGARLLVRGAFASTRDVAQGRPWQPFEGTLDRPDQAIQSALARLPLSVERAHGQGLRVGQPGAFWALVEALAKGTDRAQTDASLAKVAGLLQAHPGWATAQLALGDLALRRALAGGRNVRGFLDQAQQAHDAALRLEPRFARAWADWAALKADTGNVQDALAAFPKARARLPHSLTLHVGFAYAARYAGHMDLLGRISDRIEALNLDPERPHRMQIGLLYLDRMDAYAASLGRVPDEPRRPLLLFLRGHLALLQGRREEALGHLREAEADPTGSETFVRVAGAFRCALEGQPEEARTRLAALEEGRKGLGAPDGETSVFIAEGWALAGDADRALDALARAHGMGFGCAAWLDRDPLLAPARALPRWNTLRQHLFERQRQLVERFPVSTMGV